MGRAVVTHRRRDEHGLPAHLLQAVASLDLLVIERQVTVDLVAAYGDTVKRALVAANERGHRSTHIVATAIKAKAIMVRRLRLELACPTRGGLHKRQRQ